MASLVRLQSRSAESLPDLHTSHGICILRGFVFLFDLPSPDGVRAMLLKHWVALIPIVWKVAEATMFCEGRAAMM